MNDNPYESPNATGRPPLQVKSKLVRGFVVLLTIAAVVGVLIVLLLPARRSATEAAWRMNCANNLKHIAIALHNYESDYGCLPPAYTVDATGKRLHSWRTLILPYLEQRALYEKVDLSQPWDHPRNKEAYESTPTVYHCRSADCPLSHTTYLAVVAPQSCFRSTEPRKLSEITDDPSSTLMVLEVDSEHAVHWMSPSDVTEQWILNLNVESPLPHPGVVLALFVDGNVRAFSPALNAARIQALISVDGDDDALAEEEN